MGEQHSVRKVVSILIVLGVLGGFARAYNSRNAVLQSPQPAAAPAAADEDTKMVDLAADVVYPFDLGNDSSVICLVGNFIGHHNGAVITCDSAVRYGDQRLECFGNVLINKNETYIYGDRADYNGATNRAEVYSPLVKVVDGDATLYTYRFRFDTKLNIGEFDNGGVITNGENMLEADRGFYYADTRDVIGVDQVEIRNETYKMTGDSVIYNIETDNARFFTHTNIWNDKGEYLYADCGSYDQNDELYIVTSNGYILTETREVWSDSIDYHRNSGYALLRRDIQIDDNENKALAFGDWGEYWDDEGNALLTLNPSVISYDPEQGDSLFMRADTILMHTRSTMRDRKEAEEAERAAVEAADKDEAEQTENGERAEQEKIESSISGEDDGTAHQLTEEGVAAQEETSEAPAMTGQRRPVENGEPKISESQREVSTVPASPTRDERSSGEEPDAESEREPAVAGESEDELAEEAETEKSLSEMTPEERKAKLREIAEQERAEKKKQAEAKKKEKTKAKEKLLDAIAERRQAKKNIQLDKQARRDSIAAAKLNARNEARKQKMLARLNRKGIKLLPADSAALALTDSITRAEMLHWDSLAHAVMDSMLASWLPDSLISDSMAIDSSLLDTVYRLVRGFRNVRIFRSDFQAVCDSMASSSLDSVIHMYIEPVMWHQSNQITSEQTDIHTRNQQIEFAEFSGKPMMISRIDTLHYNQVAGKTMFSYFRDNEIYRDDVNGNAETIYYMQDEKTQELQGMMYITSADMTFYIEEQEISGITYRGNPNYVLYPMDKIPEEQEFFLQGFTWQEDRRPSQDSVFGRVLRPSIREEKEALPLPSFPISARIDEFKTRLLEQDRWYDRDDKLTDDVIYWLDMNTDWREQNARDKKMRENQKRSRKTDRQMSEESAPVSITEPEPKAKPATLPELAPALEAIPETVPAPGSAPESLPVSAKKIAEEPVELYEAEETDEFESTPDSVQEDIGESSD